MTSSYEYWINGDDIFKVETIYDLIENDLVHGDLISSALTEVNGEESGQDYLWVPSISGIAPDGFTQDGSITDEQYSAYLESQQELLVQRDQDALDAQAQYLEDLSARKAALAEKLGLTEEEVDMLVIK